MKKIHLYFRTQPQRHRYIPGDQHLIRLIKQVLGKNRTSGVKKVFLSLCKGFDLLGIDYDVNLPFKKIKAGEPVVVLGNGRYALKGYRQQNPVIAGIGLMTHPSEWPGLCTEYPVLKYLQHSDWANNVYVPYYGADTCQTWPAGIDTDKWAPVKNADKKFDILVYNKVMWDKPQTNSNLRMPLLEKLQREGLSYTEITYGHYKEEEYHALLRQSRAMIFLCEHESQGFALCEALSMNVPVIAWEPGFCLDPNRFSWNDPVIPASSVPFFDNRCGVKFKDYPTFEASFGEFWQKVKKEEFNPRAYILENLTLKKSAERMLEIIKTVYK